MPTNLEKPTMATGKGQFSFPSQRRAMLKNVRTTVHVLISHASKVMLKIL